MSTEGSIPFVIIITLLSKEMYDQLVSKRIILRCSAET